MKSTILGVGVDAISFDEARAKAIGFLDGDKPAMIFTPNPEMIMAARKNSAFRDILNSADMVVPDGIGVVLASKLGRVKIKERVTGCDLVLALFDAIKDTGYSVYFFGSKPGIAEKAKAAIEEKFPGIKIVGTSDGYYDEEKEKRIIEDIRAKNPGLVLVGTGMVKQETWIAENRDKLGAKLLIGVGGCLDVFCGHVTRAPRAMRRLGLEWLYRLIREPKRLKRQIYIPLFALLVLRERFSPRSGHTILP